MAYTTAQLVTAYTNANLGKAPDAATTLTLDAYATQSQTGGISDPAALANTLKLVNNTTAVAVETYQFFTGRAPSAAGLDYLVDSTTNTNDLNDAYYSKFAQENRFINFSINLATGSGEGAAAFATAYGSVSVAQTVATAYDKIIGNANAAAAGVDVAAAVAYLSRAENVTYLTNFVKANTGLTAAADIDLAVKAALIGEILNAATVSGIGGYAKATTALIADLADGVLSTDNAAGVNIFTAYPSAGGVGQTLALTLTTDALVGGNGNDAFSGVADGAVATQTFGALDTIDGGAGIDTLTLTNAAGTVTLSPAATVKAVENLVIRSGQNAITADVSSWTGLQTVGVEQLGTAAAISLTTKANASSVTVTGGTTVGVTDSGTTDTLTSVSVAGATGLVTATSDVLTNVSLNASNGGATVVAAAGTRSLAVSLNNVTAGTITDAEATGLSISSTGVKSSGVTVTAVKATAVTVNADEALTLADVNLTAAKTLTVTGDSLLTISATTDVTALTTITASGTTGGVTITPALGTGVTYTGGDGKDTITLGATTKAITTGAGNDTVTINAAAVGAGGTVDAGTGTDTLGLSAANAVTASVDATFASKVKGFEVLALGAVGASGTVSLTNLNDSANNAIAKVTVAGVGAGFALTLDGLVSGNTVEFNASSGAGASTVLSVTGALASTSDVINVGFTGTAAIDAKTVDASNIETVNFLTDDSATTPTGIAHVATLTDAAAKAITVTGDAGLTLTFAGTALTSFDASGVTKGAVSYTTGALTAAATLTGGAGADTLNAAASTKAVTISGGAGNDTIAGSSTIGSTLTGGDGNDTITGGAGVDTITGGAGNDSINSGAGLDVVDVGAGTDTFVLSANANGNVYATVTGMAAGDKIDFLAGGGAATFVSAKLSLAGTAAFADYLQAAAAGVADRVTWFQYGGDTYVVQDVTAGATFTNGADQVVKLTGLVDLSTATIDGAATNILTLA